MSIGTFRTGNFLNWVYVDGSSNMHMNVSRVLDPISSGMRYKFRNASQSDNCPSSVDQFIQAR